jgi:hypothetical protein
MGSLPSSSKESMTSENVDQTFISKQFDFLNDEVRFMKNKDQEHLVICIYLGFYT